MDLPRRRRILLPGLGAGDAPPRPRAGALLPELRPALQLSDPKPSPHGHDYTKPPASTLRAAWPTSLVQVFASFLVLSAFAILDSFLDLVVFDIFANNLVGFNKVQTFTRYLFCTVTFPYLFLGKGLAVVTFG